jgi:hypothetical protein
MVIMELPSDAGLLFWGTKAARQDHTNMNELPRSKLRGIKNFYKE